MIRHFLTGIFILFATLFHAQTPSGVGYPLAECNGGTCPGYASVKSHTTCSFVDTLTETLYTAGQFRTLGGQTRIGIGAIDAATGTLLPFAPVIDTFGCVYAMSIKGDTLFIGGRFTKVNGVVRNNFAAIRISNGQLLPSFNTGIGGAGDTVFAITVYKGRIYIGGKFTTVFGNARTNIARVNYDGTANAWNPSAGGIVRKTLQWQSRILACVSLATLNGSIMRMDTASVATTTLMTTTGGSPSYEFGFMDFVTRGDSIYAVGAFDGVDGIYTYNGFVACNILTAAKRTWGITIPVSDHTMRNKIFIEYYRDSLYIGTFNAYSTTNTYHRLYVVHYARATLRVLKIYNSNQTSLNGYYCADILIGNARMIEVERFARHTSFPNGSYNCSIFSWCLKIPNQCGPWLVTQPNVCPGDTFLLVVKKQAYYSTYSWSTFSSNVTLIPDGDSCSVITTGNFTFCNIRVQGVTSCGVMNPNTYATNTGAWPLPVVSAGTDDSVSCLIAGVTLYGNASTSYPPLIWNWTGPSGFSTVDTIDVTAPGYYVAEVTDAHGCRKIDSAFVFADTIPPALVPFGPPPVITCTNQTVTLDASPVYPNDSLRWIIGTGSFANAATTALPGNVLLVITDRRNGCSSTDTLAITQNMTPPNATTIYTDSILTCAVDSVLLTGNSSTATVAFYWQDTALNVFADPVWVTVPGYYQLVVTDTVNGCTYSPPPVLVYTWYTPPSVTVATDSFNINCSSDSVVLTGSSLTLAATLYWTDSASFTSTNPATAATQGMYYLVAMDTLNGCTAVDSAYVGFQATLDVTGVNDTIICPGSGAVLSVIPVGGTPPFIYQWNNSAGNAALVTVYPADTSQYIVNVTDGAGCVGEDTVIVNVPDGMMDSTLSFQPCDPLQPTGQIQIYPWGGVPPYQFSSDNGLTWQANGVFGSLTYGSYQFLIQDAIGCTRATTGSIDTNSLSPAPEFLVSTSPELGDTLVIVDISNPRPDSVVWDFPSGTTIIDMSMFAPVIVPADTGTFDISMHAFYGTCEVILTRTVNIHPFDSLSAQPWAMNSIDSLILYPNPNSGVFTVHTELEGKQDFVVLVFDELGNERARVQLSDAEEWTGQMSVSNPLPGNYILRVIAEYDSAEMFFVITQ